MLHIFHTHGNTLIPQPPELVFTIAHIVVVLHRHIELIAVVVGCAQPLVGEVAATHDDPPVAVLREVAGQA